MRNLILSTAISAVLAGCAALPPPGSCKPNPYHSGTGSPCDWSQPYYDDRYWPPVDPNSPFPPQIMDGKSRR